MPKSTKKFRPSWTFIVPAVFFVLIFVGFSFLSTDFLKKEQMSLLFVLHATKGIVTHDNDVWKLTLSDTDKRVEYFSDRPKRTVGQGELGQFLTLWGEWGFVQDPPNAAISFDSKETKIISAMIVTLEDPSYNSDTKELTFKITPLQQTPESLQYLAKSTNKIAPGELKDPTMFIDNAIISSQPENQTQSLKTFLIGMPLQEHSFHIHWKGSVLNSGQ
jgi:hypothetical protein